MTTEEMIAEREKTHGDFSEQARRTQTIKRAIMGATGWKDLSDAQKEAAEMIALKMGRIASGDPNHIDHWDDIAGYATLAAKSVDEGASRPAPNKAPIPDERITEALDELIERDLPLCSASRSSTLHRLSDKELGRFIDQAITIKLNRLKSSKNSSDWTGR